MRKILSLVFIVVVIIAIADNTVVIVRNGGRPVAVKTRDIDSICILDSKTVPAEYYNVIDTLDIVHDTTVVTRKIYESVSVTSAEDGYINIENPVVARYMNEVDYFNSSNNYSYTSVGAYHGIKTDYRKDQPRGIKITWQNPGTEQRLQLSDIRNFTSVDEEIDLDDNVSTYTLYNLLPNQRVFYRVLSQDNILKEGHFTTVGQVRMMYIPSLYNVRDLGGWPTEDGRHLRYGRIFRGGEMNDYYNIISLDGLTHQISSADSLYMHDILDIRLDMDLRDNRDLNLNDTDPTNDRNHTELGSDVTYYNEPVNYNVPYFYTYNYYYNYRFGRVLNKIINTLKSGHNVYLHCVWGADRTGTVAMLIEGLCGVSESDINKDYELTSFYKYKARTSSYWVTNLNHIKSLRGETLRDKFATYCMKIGVTYSNIVELRKIMVE